MSTKLLADTLALQCKIANLTAQIKATNRRAEVAMAEARGANERLEAALALRGNKPRTRFDIRPTSGNSESVACAMFSDWHVEEKVSSSAVNGLNSYSLRIAETRIEAVTQNLVSLINLQRKGTRIPYLVIHLGGDFMTGHIHQELVETNSLHPVETVLWLHDKLTAALRFIQKHSGVPRIICVCSVGNHARTTEKRRIKTLVENSYEWLLYQVLARQFPTFEWVLPSGYLQYLRVFSATWRFHHGDGIRYQGGVGGLTIPVNKAIAQWDKARSANLDLFGHWHQFKQDPKWVSNGSLIGYSEHAVAIKADAEPPQQGFFLWEKSANRRTITAPIFAS